MLSHTVYCTFFCHLPLRIPGHRYLHRCSCNDMGHPFPGGYKYGDLALHVGGVSNKTVKCGLSSARFGPEGDK
jgi:hypothetical protein